MNTRKLMSSVVFAANTDTGSKQIDYVAQVRQGIEADGGTWALSDKAANAVVKANAKKTMPQIFQALIDANARVMTGDNVKHPTNKKTNGNGSTVVAHTVSDVAVMDDLDSEAFHIGQQFDQAIDTSLDSAVEGKKLWDGRALAVSVYLEGKFGAEYFGDKPEPKTQDYGRGRNVPEGYNMPTDKRETTTDDGTVVKHHYYKTMLKGSPMGSKLWAERETLNNMKKALADKNTKLESIPGAEKYPHLLEDPGKIAVEFDDTDKAFTNRLNALNLAVLFLQAKQTMTANIPGSYLDYARDNPVDSSRLGKPFQIMAKNSQGNVVGTGFMTMTQFLSIDWDLAVRKGGTVRAINESIGGGKQESGASKQKTPTAIANFGGFLTTCQAIIKWLDSDEGGPDAITHLTQVTKQLANKTSKHTVARIIGDAYHALGLAYAQAEPIYRKLLKDESDETEGDVLASGRTVVSQPTRKPAA